MKGKIKQKTKQNPVSQTGPSQKSEQHSDRAVSPEAALEEVRALYRSRGRSEAWIEQRLMNAHVHHTLIEEWKACEVIDPREHASLTSTIHQAAFGSDMQEHKQPKGEVTSQSNSLLPTAGYSKDNMTEMELILSSLGELCTREISRTEKPLGFIASRDVAWRGGEVAGNARRELRRVLGEGGK